MIGDPTLPYRLAIGAIRLASPLLSTGESKLARGVEGRRHAHEVLAAWGRTLRDPAHPVVWFHAPSVGEGLQARAVIRALAALRPDVQVVFTFFSPSAESLAERMGAEVATYLPWDLRRPTSVALDALRPDLLVFTKTEVWPVLTSEAATRAIPVAIVGATVPDGAGRMRWPARGLLRPTWRALRLAGANTALDGERLAMLGVSRPAIFVTGDPGIDSAAARFGRADPRAPYLRPLLESPRPTVVAGSTWASDEAVLLPALDALRDSVPDLRAVIAPHEPDRAHVERLLASLGRSGWTTRTLGDVEQVGDADGVDAIVVDRIGVLAHLYAVATVSFVGGGFHDAGLHSVLEPAAAASPVVFGPRHHNTRAAGDLVADGGARIAASAQELGEIMGAWLQDESARNDAGGAAARYIEGHRGAAARTAEHLVDLIPPAS
jgi:3-deoxy-D-manno-octulosonic-acid transferase